MNCRRYVSLACLASIAVPSVATGQATDIRIKKPNVLLLLDNSGSMTLALNGGVPAFNAGAGNKSRWAILAETLTGTVNGLRVVWGGGSFLDQATPGAHLESNGCLPFANLDTRVRTALGTSGPSGSVGPLSWPTVEGNVADKDAVAFCKTSDLRCTNPSNWTTANRCRQLAPGEANNGTDYSQVADGLIDLYKDRIRFGLASFDSNYCVGPDGSSFTGCWFWENSWGFPGSYWHSSGGETWLNGGRAWYTSLPDYNTGYWPSSNGSSSAFLLDVGIVPPNRTPDRGRLIGFGPSDWTLDPAFTSAANCADEDSCTQLHNRMVEQAVLGLTRFQNQNTPLAAMMRDAYEFILFDTNTQGAHVPHRHDADIRTSSSLFGRLGPMNDPYFSSSVRCRNTAVLLITDGEPTADLEENMSRYADLLLDEDIPTFVVGIAMSSATYNPVGNWNAAQNVTVNCSNLTAADLGPGRICERNAPGGRRWKYADVAPFAGSPGTTPGAIRACCNLVETAVLGGTSKAYFPQNQSELKQRIGQLLNDISGGAVSRTVPVTGGVAATFAQGGTTSAPAVGYEVRSSMEVTGDSSMWRGNLERLRYACDSTDFTADLVSIDASKGDRFDANLSQPTARRFFTVVPAAADEAKGTLRPPGPGVSTGTRDNLVPGGNFGNFARLGPSEDTLVTIGALAGAIDNAQAIGTNDARDMLSLQLLDAADCLEELGASSLSICANRLLRWYGGDPNPDDGATIATDPAPSREPSSAQCPDGECSPFGAVYRSSPVFVPPPETTESDDQNFGRERVGADPSFVKEFGRRPTMLYSQTVDGQLHAFVVSRNDFTPGGRFASVPSADNLANNELWTFLPPAVLPHLWSGFNVHSRLLDGQLAWGNVVYDRILGEGVDAWKYSTVLVGCGGISAAGPFCYALDVTDPTAPRFLWQIASAGTDTGKPGASLFGDAVPGAAIAHLRIEDWVDGKEHVKAVAIIPGGSSSVTPSSIVDRQSTPNMTVQWPSGFTRRPRTKIRDWGDANPARSLTFVELKTGRVLARLVGKEGDNPRLAGATSTQLAAEVVLNDSANRTPFDSPLTGIPAVYPGGSGVAQRLYVGDADGTLWRVELDNPDPRQWRAHIAFDAYNYGPNSTLERAWVPAGPGANSTLNASVSDAAAAVLGQPIQAAPTLSTNEKEEVVVVFATGDQESFQSSSPGMLNMLVSFSDTWRPEKGESPEGRWSRYQAEVNDNPLRPTGVELAWRDGGRVTGDINLYDRQLFFAYFMPSGGSQCTYGTGGLCGIDFLDKATSTGAPIKSAALSQACTAFSQGEVVFGVKVALPPSCTVNAPSFNDPYLAGNYSGATRTNPGSYQLIFHTGQGGSAPAEGTRTKRSNLMLPSPKARTAIRSFVRVVEGER